MLIFESLSIYVFIHVFLRASIVYYDVYYELFKLKIFKINENELLDSDRINITLMLSSLSVIEFFVNF